jgi:hypothetical protein
LGIIEVGRYAELAIVVADAARTGAVYGAQNLGAAVDTNGIASAAQSDAGLSTMTVKSTSVLLPPSPANPPFPCTAVSDSGTPLPYVIVTTTYKADSLFTSQQYTFNGCAQMQVAQ